MKLVLLSGGSGKRLWPISNDARSKQFLPILKEEKTEQNQSMVQRVWNQIKIAGLENSTYVATSKNQVELLENQLGTSCRKIVEPSRRDTFPAISLAVSYLYEVERLDEEETVAILPVDPFVENDFFEKVKNLETVLNITKADLALMGVKPTFPSEKYGYIMPKDIDNTDYFQVSQFVEKPDMLKATELIEKHALWNCGIFALKIKTLKNIVESKGYPFSYDFLLNNYDLLNKNSFDYEVVEKLNNIVALPYRGYWKDLGTWNTLTDEMSEYVLGKGTLSSSSKNTHIVNELDIPIVAIGIENSIIAAGPDGILISEKDQSHTIKGYLNNATRPMYEERRWGWYKVLEYTKYHEEGEVLTKKIGINKGKNLSYHVHYHRNEHWTIVKGQGILIKNGKTIEVNAGDVVSLPIATYHALKAITDMEIIEVQTGTLLIEEDINRVFNEWEEILGTTVN